MIVFNKIIRIPRRLRKGVIDHALVPVRMASHMAPQAGQGMIHHAPTPSYDLFALFFKRRLSRPASLLNLSQVFSHTKLH